MVGILALGAGIAIYPLQVQADLPGYTFSLALMWLPIIALVPWVMRHRDSHPTNARALYRTTLVIVGPWTLLDILLAHTLFRFENVEKTTIGCTNRIFYRG